MAAKKEEAPAGAPLWMCTYSDMVTLLLCFFVLLFAMSSIDKAKWRSLVESFTGNPDTFEVLNLDGFSPNIGEGSTDGIEIGGSDEWDQTGQKVAELAMEIKLEMGEKMGTGDVIVEVGPDEIKIHMSGDVLFDTASDVIKPEGQELIAMIMEKQVLPFTPSCKELRFEGHTDRRPINTFRFPSNDYLSAARAIAVMNYAGEQFPYIKTDIMTGVIGYGERIPLLDFTGDTLDDYSKNRRVTIILVKDPIIEYALREQGLS